MRNLIFISVLTASAMASAADDFAWQFNLDFSSDDNVVAVELTPEVYARLQRQDLLDLVVVNGDYRRVPFAPEPLHTDSGERRVEVSLLERRQEQITRKDDGSLQLSIERDGSGQLSRLQIDDQSDKTSQSTSIVREWIIDLGQVALAQQALDRLEFTPAADQDFDLRIDIEASDDVSQWRTLVSEQALVSLGDANMRIERLDIPLRAAQARYLRLRSRANAALPALKAVHVRYSTTQLQIPAEQSLMLQGKPVNDRPGEFVYQLPGPLPVSRLEVVPAEVNAVANIDIATRSLPAPLPNRSAFNPEDYWNQQIGFVSYRLGRGEGELRPAPQSIALSREREWRIRSQPALSAPPSLIVYFRPERFAMLAQGQPPYRLLAGSAKSMREAVPIDVVLMAVRQEQGSGWRANRATIGQAVAGNSNPVQTTATAAPSFNWRQAVLWTLLIAGALIVSVAALRLLRSDEQQA